MSHDAPQASLLLTHAKVADTSFELGAELLSSPWESSIRTDLSTRLERLQEQAWEALYLAHRSLIRGVLAGYLGYSRDLEAVTQSVIVAALNRVASKSAEVPLEDAAMRAWLVALAVQVGQLESKRRRAKLDTQTDWAPESSQLLRRAHGILSQLPSPMRLTWILRHLEKMSVADIAEAMRVPVGTVKARLTQAETAFRRLAKCDPLLRTCLE